MPTWAHTLNWYMMITSPVAVRKFDIFSEIISSMDIFVTVSLVVVAIM